MTRRIRVTFLTGLRVVHAILPSVAFRYWLASMAVLFVGRFVDDFGIQGVLLCIAIHLQLRIVTRPTSQTPAAPRTTGPGWRP